MKFLELLRFARACFWYVLACVVLRCGVSVWIVVECIGLFRLLSVCREIAKIIKSVMAITELKKDNKKRDVSF